MPGARANQHEDYGNPWLNMSFNPAGLKVQAAASPTFATTNAVNYTIDGIFYNKVALASQSLLTTNSDGSSGGPLTATDLTIPTGGTGYIVVALDAAGNTHTYAGTTLAPNGVRTFNGKMPDYPKGVAPIGFMKIVSTTAPFIFGTTNLDAAGVTVTYRDMSAGGYNQTP